MNQRAVKLAEKVANELSTITDAARELHDAIANDEEDAINDIVDNVFPTPTAMGRTFEKLGDLLTNKPWESGRKGKKNG